MAEHILHGLSEEEAQEFFWSLSHPYRFDEKELSLQERLEREPFLVDFLNVSDIGADTHEVEMYGEWAKGYCFRMKTPPSFIKANKQEALKHFPVWARSVKRHNPGSALRVQSGKYELGVYGDNSSPTEISKRGKRTVWTQIPFADAYDCGERFVNLVAPSFSVWRAPVVQANPVLRGLKAW